MFVPLGSLCVSSCMSLDLAYSTRSFGITQQDSKLTWLITGLTCSDIKTKI